LAIQVGGYTDDIQIDGGQTVGNNAEINDEQVNELRLAENKAREEYQSKFNEELGALLSYSTQVVSGINYKMTFAKANSQNNDKVTIVVYIQSWTHTIKVTSITDDKA